LAKVNYQYEKRQKELQKKRKKEQKEKLKQNRKNSQSQETPVMPVPAMPAGTPVHKVPKKILQFSRPRSKNFLPVRYV
jgi:hypothetical protein